MMELVITKTLNFLFVTNTGKASDASKLLMLSYMKIVELFEVTKNVKWLSTADAISLSKNRNQIFVVEDGQIYESLASDEAIVLAPGTILQCKLTKNEFEEKLPTFHNLVVTSTGISEAEKMEINELINKNGGLFSAIFNGKLTNILITQPNQRNSEKFKAAVKCRKECLMVDWVKDSVKAGFALPYVNYRVHTLALTPTPNRSNKHTLDHIDISLVQIGCLIGCKISLCGFDGTDVQKLKKIITIGGAICFDEHGPNVEYVIVGKPSPSELSTIQSLEGSNIVTVDWLVACISAKGIADPKDFVYRVETSNPIVIVRSPANNNTSGQNPPPRSNISSHASDARLAFPPNPSSRVNIVVKQEVIDLCDEEPEKPVQSGQSDPSLPTTGRKIRLSASLTNQTEEQIVQLGGAVCEELSGFDPSCTHLICSNPNQSEYTMSIIASGRWLLCPAYIEDSHKAGHFLNEEDYEWGNPIAIAKLPSDVDAKSKKIAMVSHKWRKELHLKSKKENKPVGMFSGIRAILHSTQKDSFKRLLEAGCGVVVDIEQPYAEKNVFQGVTHCFVDKRMAQMSESDMAAMKAAGVHCVTILYLQACLQEDTLPSEKEYAAK